MMATLTLILLILTLSGSILTNFLLARILSPQKKPTIQEKIVDTMEEVKEELEKEKSEVERILQKDFVGSQQEMDALLKKYNIKFKAP